MIIRNREPSKGITLGLDVDSNEKLQNISENEQSVRDILVNLQSSKTNEFDNKTVPYQVL